MSENTAGTPVGNLKRLREVLVEQRRKTTAEAIQAYNAPAEKVTAIQAQIEAIDRAIADEERLVPSVYPGRGLL